MTDRSNRRRRHKRHKARTHSRRIHCMADDWMGGNFRLLPAIYRRLLRPELFSMTIDISALTRRAPRFAFLEDPK